MPKTKLSLFTKLSIAVLAVVLFVCVAVSLFVSAPTADAYTTNGAPAATASIYDTSNKKFSTEGLQTLFQKLGSSDGMYDNLPAATTAGQSLASQNIIVELGGLKWIAVYYSAATTSYAGSDGPATGKASDGDKVLTLWLAEQSSKTYAWNTYRDSGSNTGEYPSNNYGTSMMRAIVLNNGGDYYYGNTGSHGTNATASNKQTASKTTTNGSTTEFAYFTTNAIGLAGDGSNYLVSPRYIAWQYNQSAATQIKNSSNSAWVTYDFNNDAWGHGGTYNSSYNWGSKTGYSVWKDDLLWLPSLTETGTSSYTTSLWNLTTDQRNSSSNIWLRSGNYNSSPGAYYLGASGGNGSNYVYGTYYVRPALHLNLASAAGAAGLDKPHTDHTYEWRDDGQGNHYQHCTYQNCPDPDTAKTPHTVTSGVYSDATYHTGTCTVCNISNVKVKHESDGNGYTNSANHNETSHWLKCKICSQKYSEVTHTWNYGWKPAETDHYQTCPDCNQEKRAAHSATTWTDAKDGANHQSTCVCTKVLYEAHILGNWQVDASNLLYRKCTKTGCTYETEHEEYGGGNHEHDYTLKNQSDDVNHWDECECGARNNVTPHSFGSWTASNGSHSHQCNTCNRTVTDTHLLSKHAGTTPDCTNTGLKDYFECLVCNIYFSDASGVNQIELESWKNSEDGGLLPVDTTNGHVWDTVWHYDDENGHYHECTITSSHHSDPLTAHDYNNKFYDDGDGSHYQVCKDCGYETDLVAHTVASWSSNGSETHQGVCSGCQLTVSNVHQWNDDAWKFAQGGSTHWHECSVCQQKKDETAHVLTNVTGDSNNSEYHTGSCECGATDIQQAHVLQWQQEAAQHYQKCTVQGCTYATSPEAHTGSVWKDTGDQDTHTGYCPTCGMEQATSAHSWDDKAASSVDGHWDATCSDCGAKKNYSAHQWDDIEWTVAEGRHYKECTTCNTKYRDEAHVLSIHAGTAADCTNTGLKDYWECGVCSNNFSNQEGTKKIEDLGTWKQTSGDEGGLIPTNSEHVWGEWELDLEKGEHVKKCKICKTAENERGKHSVTYAQSAGDQGHTGPCDVCSQVVTVEHTLNENFKDASNHNINGHWNTCSVCNGQVNYTAHEWNEQWQQADSDHYKVCETCEQEKREAHVMSKWTTAGNTDHTRQCDVCQKTETSTHVWGDTYFDNGDGNHYQKCNDCDAHSDGVVHDYDNKYYDDNKGNHYQVCKDCGNTTDAAKHTVTTATKSNGNETHTGECDVCHLTVSVAHEWNDTTWTFTSGGSTHWHECTVCHEKKDETDHVLTNVKWDNSDTSFHTGDCECGATDVQQAHVLEWQKDSTQHYQKCTVDGCTYQTQPENHSGNIWKDTGDSEKHTGYCPTCGMEQATGAHNWTEKSEGNADGHWDATCSDCGAKRNYSAHQWDSIIWTVENGRHYKQCTTCNVKYRDEAHVLNQHVGTAADCTNTGLKDYWDCAICKANFSDENGTKKIEDLDAWKKQSGDEGGLLDVEETAHKWSSAWKFDNESGHYHECELNPNHHSEPVEEHKLKFVADENGKTHHQECADCGYTAQSVAHTLTIATSKGAQHEGYCDDCHAKVTESHVEKAGSYRDADRHDVNSHWDICNVCGGKFNETTHKWDGSWTQNGDRHFQECDECGARNEQAHVWSGWKDDAESHEHYRECQYCDATDGRSKHVVTSASKVDEATHQGLCKECGLFVTVEHNTVGDYFNADNHDQSGHWLTCSVCNEKVGYEAHNWDSEEIEWQVQGNEHFKVCSDCGQEYGRNEHALEEIPGQNPTDEQPGYKKYYKCIECGKYFSDENGTEEIDPEEWTDPDDPNGPGYIEPDPDYEPCEHEYTVNRFDAVNHWTECALCGERQAESVKAHTFSGWTAANGKHTKRCNDDCGYSYSEQHTVTYYAGQAATCSEYGYKSYYFCEDCNTYFEDANGYKVIGDSNELDQWKQAGGRVEKDLVNGHKYTKANHNVIGHWTECELCGEQQPGAFVEHDWDRIAYTVEGNEHWKTCTACGQEYNRGQHALEEIPGQKPTEDQAGYKKYYYCVVCGRYFSDESGTEEIDPGEWTDPDDPNGPGYVEPGPGEDPDPDHQHKFEKPNHDATYHWMECSECGERNEESVKTHEFDGWTASGNKHSKQCSDSNCQYVFTEEHALEAFAGQAATCGADGFKPYFYCDVCKTYYEEVTCNTEIPDIGSWKEANGRGNLPADSTNGHVWGEWKNEGDKHYRECTICFTRDTETYGEHVISKATAVANGHQGICDVCGFTVTKAHETSGDVKDANNHDQSGHWLTCTVCGERTQFSTHNYGDYVAADGKHNKTCSDCEYVLVEEHVLAPYAGKDATCSDYGQQPYWYCATCKTYFEDAKGTQVIGNQDKLNEWLNSTGRIDKDTENGHKWSEQLTGDVNGHWYACTICGAKNESSFVPHAWDGTWTQDGDKHYQECSECGVRNEQAHIVESWTNANDGINHKGTCTACDAEVTEKHVLSELKQDGDNKYYQKCTVEGCNFETEHEDMGETHIHTWSIDWYSDESYHWKQCTICGMHQEDIAHVLGSWTAAGGNHYQECSECNRKVRNEAHVLTKFDGTKSDCTNNGLEDYWVCPICNKSFSDEGLTEIDFETWKDTPVDQGGGQRPLDTDNGHVWSDWKLDLENGEHFRTCTICKTAESERGKHVVTIANKVDDSEHEGYCDVCNQIVRVAHVTSGDFTTKGNHDETGHWLTCSVCNDRIEFKAHDWISEDWSTNESGEHWKQCDDCGQEYGRSSHAMQSFARVEATDERTGHLAYWKCIICGTYFKDATGHQEIGDKEQFDAWIKTEQKDGGGLLPINPDYEPDDTHKHDYSVSNNDAVNHWTECSICGARTDISAHEVSNWTVNNVTTHTGKCDVCEKTITQAHNLDQNNTCEDCGFTLTSTPDCNHVVTSGTSNGNESHTGVCEICGQTVSVAHTWSEEYVTDENGHWYECTVCGERKDYAKHEIEWTTDGEHTHSGNCAVCGEHVEADHRWLFGTCLDCKDNLNEYAEIDVGIAAIAIVAQLFGLIAVAAIISRRMKK